jgi:hypothetical protein
MRTKNQTNYRADFWEEKLSEINGVASMPASVFHKK